MGHTGPSVLFVASCKIGLGSWVEQEVTEEMEGESEREREKESEGESESESDRGFEPEGARARLRSGARGDLFEPRRSTTVRRWSRRRCGPERSGG